MKLLAKAILLLLIKLSCAQTAVDHSVKKIDYGFSFATFSGTTLNGFLKESSDKKLLPQPQLLCDFNYGWKQGLFLWINLSPCFAYRPELNAVFCVYQHMNLSSAKKQVYSTSVGFEFKPQFIIRIGCRNTDPVIKLARNMSYYLTQKQSYLIIGPKFSYQKPDKGFLKNNNERNYSVGIVFGGGTDYLFPNLDVAPELTMSVEYQPGNDPEQKKGSNRYYTSLSLTMNFF